MRYADFFISKSFMPNNLPRFLFNITSLIKDQLKHLVKNTTDTYYEILSDVHHSALEHGISEQLIVKVINDSTETITLKMWESANEHLFPSYRNLLLSVINYFVQDNIRIDIDHDDLSYENYSLSFPEIGEKHLSDALDKAINIEKEIDKNRAHELRMLQNSSKRKYDGTKIACLVRINILDLGLPPEKMIRTDIDAALLKISKDEIKLELYEAKNIKRQKEKTAAKELKTLLVPVLNKKARYRITTVKGYGAKLTLSCKSD